MISLKEAGAERWLEHVEKLDGLIDAKIKEREQLWALATKTTANIDGMPHDSGVSDIVGNTVVKLVTLAEETDNLIDQYIDHKQRVIDVIEQLPPKLYTVIHQHYIQYKPFNQIAKDMGLCTMQIWRYKCQAIELLGVMGEKI